jgi:hypothetical protein
VTFTVSTFVYFTVYDFRSVVSPEFGQFPESVILLTKTGMVKTQDRLQEPTTSFGGRIGLGSFWLSEAGGFLGLAVGVKSNTHPLSPPGSAHPPSPTRSLPVTTMTTIRIGQTARYLLLHPLFNP